VPDEGPQPFKTLAVTLTVGWLAVFVIVPNLLTLAADS
jgi:hypothetical protein